MWGIFSSHAWQLWNKKCGLIEEVFKNEAAKLDWNSIQLFPTNFLQMFSLLVPAVITQPPLEPFINYAQGGISPETSSILDFIRDANYSVSNPSLLTTFGFSPIVIPWWMHQTIRIHSHLHFFQVPIHNLRGENLLKKMPQFQVLKNEDDLQGKRS